MGKTKYIVIESQDYGGLFCLGIFDDIDKAWGFMMRRIWEFESNYKDDGETFRIFSPYMMEGEGGYRVKVDYKAKTWEKAVSEYFYILFHEEE